MRDSSGTTSSEPLYIELLEMNDKLRERDRNLENSDGSRGFSLSSEEKNVFFVDRPLVAIFVCIKQKVTGTKETMPKTIGSTPVEAWRLRTALEPPDIEKCNNNKK